MLLQAMADQFGLPVTEYAETAFKAELAPKFSYGCAVFLDTDRVNFQKEGYQKEELLAGLAQVLPKNVWQYVVQIPRLASLGTQLRAAGRHAVQPGRGQGAGRLHQAARAGRRGVRAPAHRRSRRDRRGDRDAARGQAPRPQHASSASMRRSTSSTRRKNDESTTCHFCPNECKRTFIDANRPDGCTSRYISGFSCEKGTVEIEGSDARRWSSERKKLLKTFPNLVDYEARKAFLHFYEREPLPAAGTPIEDVRGRRSVLGRVKRERFTRGFERSSDRGAAKRRKRFRIGMPRVLNMYSTAPFFRTYFEALGLDPRNVVFSDATTEEMWVEGGKYGSIDPCFPTQGRAGAHPQPALPQAHRRARRSTTSSSRSSRTCRSS